MSGWRPALRIARRSVRRQLWRSILIVTLVAIPIAGATVADGIIRTRTDPDASRYQDMGTADAVVSVAPSVDLAGLLPAGSRMKAAGTDHYKQVRLAAGDRIVRTMAELVEADDVLTEHLMRLSAGRLPRDADEVLVSEPLADRLGVRVDDRPAVTVLGGPTLTVTGLVAYRQCGLCEAVVAPPGSVLARAMSPEGRIRYAVDLPAGTDAEELGPALAGLDADLNTRESYVAPWTFGEYLEGMSGQVGVLAGLGLLEIVLLAGAAFAVGARRQVRELGLLAANGATTKQLIRVMLAQGLVLGVLGAGGGVLLGAIVTVLGMPLWQRLYPMSTDLRFGWPELAIVAAAGVLACVVAAVVPAIGVARMRPVDALARRFRTTATAARLPVLGVVLLLAGGTWIVVEGLLGRARLNEVRAGVLPSVDQDGFGVMAGSAIMVLGLILVIPALVAVAGRFGARLPLSGRLAVRDAVRHRYRTVAAVAAVMIAVAGAVATAFVFRADAADDPKYLPDHAILLEPDTVYLTSEEQREQLDWASARLTGTLPGASAHGLATLRPNGDNGSSGIALFAPEELDRSCPVAVLGAGTEDLIGLSTGRAPDAAVRSALAAGKVVVFDDCLVSPTGTVRAELSSATVELPAYVAERAAGAEDYARLPGAFISTQTAAAHGWTPYVASVVVTYAATADQNEVDEQVDVLVTAGVYAPVDKDESAELDGLYLLLAGGSALVTLLGVGVTAALSAAEGRADLATLAALGAPPRRRRALAGAHALVIAGLGALLGMLLGGFVGYAVLPLGYESDFAVPWRLLGLTAVGVPCVAALVAMLTTRSRLPMLQRRGS